MAKVNIGKETGFKIKIEKEEEMENSLFRDIYLKSAKLFNEIVSINELENEDKYINNIIGFIGDRGSGKTSTMMSFCKSIKEKYEFKDDKELKEEYEKINDTSTVVLDIIDPSIFNENESIIEVIIASMFKNFKKQVDNEEIEYTKQKKLLIFFQKVFRNLKVLHQDRDKIYNENCEDIEILLELSSSMELKNNLKELIKLYLQVMYKKSKDSFLIIPIDDLDLSIKYGEKMCEDIRKYLIQANVVILMAVKIKQLRNVMIQKYNMDFKGLDSIDDKNNITKNMADNYLEKLIPLNRRLYLPNLQTDNVTIKIENREYSDLEECILQIINEKIGLIFIKPQYGINCLTPKGLREATMFISFLLNLEDPQENNLEIRTKNFNVFVKYFVNNWCNCIRYDFQEFLRELYFTDIGSMNRKTVDFLYKFIKYNYESNNKWNMHRNSDKMKEILKYFDKVNGQEIKDENISLGDVLTMLDFIETYFKEYYKEVYAIKTIYTCTFFKYLNLKKEIEKVRILIGGDMAGRLDKKKENNNIMNLFIRDLNLNDDTNKYKEIKEGIVNNLDGDKEKLLNIFVLFSFLSVNYQNDNSSKNNNDKYYEIPLFYGNGELLRKKYTFKMFNIITNIFYYKGLLNRLFFGYSVIYEEESADNKNDRLYSISDENKVKFSKFLDEMEEWENNNLKNSLMYNLDYLQRMFDNCYFVLKNSMIGSEKKHISFKEISLKFKNELEKLNSDIKTRNLEIIGQDYKKCFLNFNNPYLKLLNDESVLKFMDECIDSFISNGTSISTKTYLNNIKEEVDKTITGTTMSQNILNIMKKIKENITPESYRELDEKRKRLGRIKQNGNSQYDVEVKEVKGEIKSCVEKIMDKI